MEKKKRIISKLIFVLVLAAVVSMCFVGTTLARYASGGDGTATTTVAKWDVDFAIGAEKVVDLGKLSPDAGVYQAESVRSHTSDRTLVATITNKSDVSAAITVSKSDIAFNPDSSFGLTAWTETSTDGAPTADQVKGLFTITIYTNTSNNAGAATEYSSPVTLGPGNETETVLYVYAEVTWTSADETLKGNADALDTWVGQNITSFSTTLTFDAVQASEQPTA